MAPASLPEPKDDPEELPAASARPTAVQQTRVRHHVVLFWTTLVLAKDRQGKAEGREKVGQVSAVTGYLCWPPKNL